jgi:type III pantothenate kinase
MMNNSPLLLLDAGNSNVKAACYTHGKLGPVQSWPHTQINTLPAWLDLQPQRPVRAGMVSVATNALQDVLAQTLQTLNIPLVRWQHKPLPPGFVNLYQAPTLGADRLAGMVGACASAQAPVVVLATFGTATTVDLAVNRHYHGGLIAPGVQMMLDSLHQGTAHLPLAQGRYVDVPANTHDAIFTGMCAAQLGALNHMLQAARAHGTPQLIVSGGAAHLIAAHLPAHSLLPHAGLHGLAVIAPFALATP